MEGAGGGIDRGTGAVVVEEFLGALGELAADFPALAFDPGNGHVVIAGGLVSHPGDGGGFSALLDGDALGAGDRAAADRRGVGGDAIRHGGGGELVTGMEREVAQDRRAEVSGVSDFCFGPALAAGIEFLLVSGIGAFEGELSAEGVHAVGGSPDAAGEAFVAFLFNDGPVGAVGLDPATQGRVARRKELPVDGHGADLAGGVEDMARSSEGADFE